MGAPLNIPLPKTLSKMEFLAFVDRKVASDETGRPCRSIPEYPVIMAGSAHDIGMGGSYTVGRHPFGHPIPYCVVSSGGVTPIREYPTIPTIYL